MLETTSLGHPAQRMEPEMERGEIPRRAEITITSHGDTSGCQGTQCPTRAEKELPGAHR